MKRKLEKTKDQQETNKPGRRNNRNKVKKRKKWKHEE